jgi:hypothetical protein
MQFGDATSIAFGAHSGAVRPVDPECRIQLRRDTQSADRIRYFPRGEGAVTTLDLSAERLSWLLANAPGSGSQR